jgi:hypothetical protein
MRIALAGVGLVCVLAIAFAAGLRGQGPPPRISSPPPSSTGPIVAPVGPTVVSGMDLGFRINGLQGDTAIGTFVVRINGRWIPAVLDTSYRGMDWK